MSALAEVLPEPPAIRRFERPDLSRHGAWMLPRLLATYPHLDERSVASWLQNVINNNECLFLFQKNAVALAQAVASNSLAPEPVIWERFVWVEDPKDKDQIAAATGFYDYIRIWAKHQGAKVLVVEELSDVPHEMIKDVLDKRLFSRQQWFARI